MKHTHPSTLVVDIVQIHMESTQISDLILKSMKNFYQKLFIYLLLDMTMELFTDLQNTHL